jgi:hypothetical protein
MSAELMRPNVIEVRVGPEFYLARADYTFGEWHETPWGIQRPIRLVLEDLALLNPFYTVEAPEEHGGRRWEDA